MSRDLNRLLQNDDALSQTLHKMPRPAPPAGMTTSLRVVASRERAFAVRQRSVPAWRRQPIWLREWMDQTKLLLENVMRPFAVPFAGGLFSTVALFSMFVVPTYPVLARAGGSDVPIMLVTEAQVKTFSTVGSARADIVIDVFVDENGTVSDYQVVSGAKVLDNKEVRSKFENFLVFTTFVPRTSFGRPTPTKMRMGFISLKG
jgi:hypothetical protein